MTTGSGVLGGGLTRTFITWGQSICVDARVSFGGVLLNLYDEPKAFEELQRAVKSNNPDLISKVLLVNIWPLYCSHYELLIAAIESLPVRVLERYPVLRAVHPMTPVLARTTRQFKPLMNQDDARTMTPVELDTFTLVQMVSFRFSGDVAASVMFARRLDDRLLKIRVESRERADGPLWFYRDQIGVTMLLSGDSSRALLEFGTSAQLGALSKQPDAVRVALGHAALAHAVRGSLDAAEQTLEEISLQPTATPAHAVTSRLAEDTAEALVAVERMDSAAERLLNRLGPTDSVDTSWPFTLLARARFLLAHQRAEEALETIQLADKSHPGQCGAVSSDIINALSIEALAATGNVHGAWKLADEIGTPTAMTRLATMRLALQVSRFDVAHDLRRRINGTPLSPGQQAELALLTTWLEFAQAGAIDRQAALQIARLTVKGNGRRLLSTVPYQLIEQVRSKLIDDDLLKFDMVIRGLPRIEMTTRPALTPSELRVLSALPVHPTTAAIAAAFHVSPNTIKSQLKALYRKLECSSREGAIKTASQMRIIVDEGNYDSDGVGSLKTNSAAARV